MKQYIDKAVVMAKISDWIKDARRRYTLSKVQFSLSDRIESLENLLSFLDSLEVKELDLDKEARKYLLNEHKSPLSAVFHQTDLRVEMQYHKDIENAFKAGYELGLKVSKKGGEE